MRKRILLGGLVVLSLLTSGCFLLQTLHVEVAETIRESVELYIASVQANATVAICDDFVDFPSLPVNCRYLVNGVEIGSTARFVSELGIFGLIVDPIVLELPAGVTNIGGTFSGGGTTGNLVVYPNLSFVPIDDTRTLTPAAGKQLAIVDLPASAQVNGVNYQFNMTFQQVVPAGTPPTQYKVLFAGKIIVAGKAYYPPILPCVDSFATLPLMQFPALGNALPINVPGGLTPCANKVFQYFRQPRLCDLDNDTDVDANDINLIMNVRNRAAATGDPRDVNADALINANDARFCTIRCSRAGCAV
jgi:hypothetical protein